MNEQENAFAWSEYYLGQSRFLSDISGGGGGFHTATPKTTIAGGGKGVKPKSPAPKNTGFWQTEKDTDAAAAGAGPRSALDRDTTSEALSPAAESTNKKLFFDVISKPVAIAGGAVLLLGLGFLILKPKHKKSNLPALIK